MLFPNIAAPHAPLPAAPAPDAPAGPLLPSPTSRLPHATGSHLELLCLARVPVCGAHAATHLWLRAVLMLAPPSRAGTHLSLCIAPRQRVAANAAPRHSPTPLLVRDGGAGGTEEERGDEKGDAAWEASAERGEGEVAEERGLGGIGEGEREVR